jgi:uncharacterized membrane protein
MAPAGWFVKRHLSSFVKQVKSNILYGVFLLLPLVVSIFIMVKLFHWMDSWLYLSAPATMRRYIFPGMGIFVLLLGTYMLGAFARNYIGRRLLGFGNMIIRRIPFFNKIYEVLKQVMEAIAGPKKNVLDKVVLVEFPREGSYCLAFVTSRVNTAISKAAGSDLISIFLPTAPNPASGFLIYMPASKVHDIDISMEMAIKLIMSAGVVNPDNQATMKSPDDITDIKSLIGILKPPKKSDCDPRD